MSEGRKLTDAQKESAVAWVDAKVGPCPACSQRGWSVEQNIVELYSGGVHAGGIHYPTILLVCRHCAHMMCFNAIMMGVEKRDEKGTDDA